jgi:hypothetical protein
MGLKYRPSYLLRIKRKGRSKNAAKYKNDINQDMCSSLSIK